MKIKLFEEYKLGSGGDIAMEYAKQIISKFIDKDITENLTLEQIFHKIVKDDDLDESQQHIIIQELIEYTYNLNGKARQVRTLLKSTTDKYNL